MRLSRLTQSRPTNAETEIAGEKVYYCYDRSKINGDFWALGRWRAQLAHALLSWDIADEESGAVLAPAEGAEDRRSAWLDVFAPIPDDLLVELYYAMLADFNGEKKVKIN